MHIIYIIHNSSGFFKDNPLKTRKINAGFAKKAMTGAGFYNISTIGRLIFSTRGENSQKNNLIFWQISDNISQAEGYKEVQTTMAKCDVCGKRVSFGIKISHSHRRTNRTWKPNVRRVKAVVDGSPRRIYACTRCLRSGKVSRAV